MGTADVKRVLVELTRSGCRVETLMYDPPAVTFRARNGARCALTSDHDTYQLAQQADDAGDEKVVRFPTLREALHAATAA